MCLTVTTTLVPITICCPLLRDKTSMTAFSWMGFTGKTSRSWNDTAGVPVNGHVAEGLVGLGFVAGNAGGADVSIPILAALGKRDQVIRRPVSLRHPASAVETAAPLLPRLMPSQPHPCRFHAVTPLSRGRRQRLALARGQRSAPAEAAGQRRRLGQALCRQAAAGTAKDGG